MRLRIDTLVFLLGLTIGASACNRTHSELNNDRDQNAERAERERKSAAYKLGEMTHDLSKEAGKAAKAAGKEIGKEAHQMREGWKEAQREDRAKKNEHEK